MGNSKDITLTNSVVSAAGTVGFSVGSTNYSVSIERVDSGSNPLILDASDFSYTESTKELTLTSSGLTKFQTASASLTARQKYQYTITFKFTDYASDNTKNLDVSVNLIKVQMITKTDIENMMKTVTNSDIGPDDITYSSENNGEIVLTGKYSSHSVKRLTFSFASKKFSEANPNFHVGNKSASGGMITLSASKKASVLAAAIGGTQQFKEYFGSVSDIDYNSTPPTISFNNKDCTFTLKFKKINSGYALSSEVAHLMTSGLTIKLSLNRDTFDWVE